MAPVASSHTDTSKRTSEGDPTGLYSQFTREFHEQALVPLLDQRRLLAGRGCLGLGLEVAPRSRHVALARRNIWRRVEQKLDSLEAISLALRCGTLLLEVGEFLMAESFFDEALVKVRVITEGESADAIKLAAWRADAVYGRTECEVQQIRCRDSAVRYPWTAQRLFGCACDVRVAMVDLLALPLPAHERVAWLLLNGAGLLHGIVEPLAALGGPFARHAAEYLLWAARVLDSCMSLATTKYLPVRCRLYALAARACNDAGRPEAAKAVVALLGREVDRLRAAEEMQLPLPRPVAAKLISADNDLSILGFSTAIHCDKPFTHTDTDADTPGAVMDSILERTGLGATTTAGNRHFRARALFEALEIPNGRGLAHALDETVRVDGAADNVVRNHTQLAALTHACATATLSDDAVGATPALAVPQLMELARVLFVLRDTAQFQHIVAITRAAIDSPDMFDESPRLPSGGDAGPPIELVSGAAAPFRQELSLLESLDAYLRWDINIARDVAAAAAASAEAGRANSSGMRRIVPTDSVGLSGSNETMPYIDVTALERAAAAAGTEAVAITTAIGYEEKPPVPIARATAIAKLLHESTTGEIGAATVAWRQDVLVDAAVFLWRTVCQPAHAALEERRQLDVDATVALPSSIRASAERTAVTRQQLTDIGAALSVPAPPTSELEDLFLRGTAAIHAVLVLVDADDALLRARIALALGHSLRERGHQAAAPLAHASVVSAGGAGALRSAVQVLRTALDAINAARARAVEPDLHHPKEAMDHVALARQAVTTEVDDAAARAAADGRLGAHGYGGSGIFGSGSQLDTLHQALAAVHLDLVSVLVLIELDLAEDQARRDVARSTGRGIGYSAASYGALSTEHTIFSRHTATQHVEVRVMAEWRRHHAARAMARARFAARRLPQSPEREECLQEALHMLGAAAVRETEILSDVASWGDCCSDVHVDHVAMPRRATPLAPAVVARAETAITLQPRAWNGSTAHVDHLRCFGKAAGAGTDVSLTNVDLEGLGAPIAFNRLTGKSATVRISGLCANEAYVFAIAAFDADGRPVSAIGETSIAIDTLAPLPLPLCYAVVARAAVSLGVVTVAASAARVVYKRFVDVDAGPGHELKENIVERASLAELYAFIDCAHVLADHPENGGLPLAFIPGVMEPGREDDKRNTHDPIHFGDAESGGKVASHLSAVHNGAVAFRLAGPVQVAQYTKLQIRLKAVEIAASIARQDPEKLLDSATRCYHAALPLLRLRAASIHGILLRSLVTLHQAFWLVPPPLWDIGVREIFACVCYQMALAGDACAEPQATAFALLGMFDSAAGSSDDNIETVTGAQPIAVQPPQGGSSTSPRAETLASPRSNPEDRAAAPSPPVFSTCPTWPDEPCEQQLALLQVWCVDARFRGAGISTLRAATALNSSDGPLPLLAVAAENPAEAWTAVIALADDQRVCEDAARSQSPLDRSNADGDDSVRRSEVAAPPCVEHSLRHACRVFSMALRHGAFAAVSQWSAAKQLIAKDRLAPLAVRVLDREYVTEVRAATELAASSAATRICERPTLMASASDDDEPAQSMAVEPSHEGRHSPAAAAAAAAEAAASDSLPYLYCAERHEAIYQSAANDPEAGILGLASRAPPRDLPDLASELIPSADEAVQLLWLAEIEKLRGLAALSELFAGPGRTLVDAGDEDIKGINSGGATISAIGALVERCAKVVTLTAQGCLCDAGPLADLSGPVSQGLFDGDDGGDEAEPHEEVLERRASASEPIDAYVGAIAALATEEAGSAISGASNGATYVGDTSSHDGLTEPSCQPSVARRFVAATCHLSRAITRARRAHTWRQMVSACAHLWNSTVSLWVSPLAFRPQALIMGDGKLDREGDVDKFHDQPQLDPSPFVDASHALLDVLELVTCTSTSEYEPPPTPGSAASVLDDEKTFDPDDPDVSPAGGLLIRGAPSGPLTCALDIADGELADIGLDPEWGCQFVTFTLRCLTCARRWDALVPLAQRLVTSEAVLNVARTSYGGPTGALLREAHVLVAHAQQQVVSRATARLRRAQAMLEAVTAELAEASQRRLGRRRVRQGRHRHPAERSEEERALEARQTTWTGLVGSYRAARQVAEHRVSLVRATDREFRKRRPLAAEALDSCRSSLDRSVLAELIAPGDARGATPLRALPIRGLTASYKRASRLIRERREPLLLAQALQDEGDLQLAEGNTVAAGGTWSEGVDALFSTLDTHKSWREVLAKGGGMPVGNGEPLYDDPSVGAWLYTSLGLTGCLVGGVLLSKIARFTCRNDLDARLDRSRFAALLFRAVFSATLPHPAAHAMPTGSAQRVSVCDVAFALYRPSLLTPQPVALFGARHRLAPSSLTRALVTAAEVLIDADRAPSALPLCCLLEHIAAEHRLDARATAAARVVRLRALTAAGLVAEAASVLSSLLCGADLPVVDGAYMGILHRNPPPTARTHILSACGVEPARTLPFYGLVPWDASAPLGAAANTSAATWLTGNATDSVLDDASGTKGGLFWRPTDAEGTAGVAAATMLRQGCAGLKSLHLAAAYGRRVLVALAISRAELLMALGRAGISDDAAAHNFLCAADSVAAEVQRTILNNVQHARPTGTDHVDGTKSCDMNLTSKALELDWAGVRDVARCSDLRARGALIAGKPSVARQHAATLLAMISRHCARADRYCLGSRHHVDTAAHDVDAGLWTAGRVTLARCALLQGRLRDAVAHCDLGVTEARTASHGGAARRFVTLRVTAAARRGDGIITSLKATEMLLKDHEHADAQDCNYAHALVLAASLRRDAALGADDARTARSQLEVARTLLDRADAVLLAQARACAWTGIRPRDMSLANLYLPSLEILPAVRTAASQTLLDLAAAVDVILTTGANGNALRDLARVRVEEALATTRHCASTSPALRAAMLLLIGRAQRATATSNDDGRRQAAQEALSSALVAAHSAGHDHATMRAAALELVLCHHGARALDRTRASRLTMHFLLLAALLARQQWQLVVETATLCVGELNLDAAEFEISDVEDMGLADGRGGISAAKMVRHLVVVRREADGPGVLTDDQARGRAAAARIHVILYDHNAAYREACCVPTDALNITDDAVPAVPEALVCVQWVDVRPGADTDITTLAGNGLYPVVEAHILLGVITTDTAADRFSTAPYLCKVGIVRVVDIRALKRRASELRYALRRTLSRGSLDAPPRLRAKFDNFLCDVRTFLRLSSETSRVRNSTIVEATEHPDVKCDMDTLMLLELFFSQDLGARISHAAVCHFLRDVLEPIVLQDG